MKYFFPLILLFLSVACSVTRQVTPREQTTVEIRTETVYVPDTVYVQLPAVSQSVETLDTISVLENRYAVSEASVSGNILKHPCFDEMRRTGEGFRVIGELTNTDTIMNNTFWIGVYPGMTQAMLDMMVKTIKEFCGR